MATLATCIRKAGKALNSGDADAIRGIYEDLQAGGLSSSAAADQAINEYLDILSTEQTDITEQIREQGGMLPDDDIVRFAPDSSRVKRIAQRLNIRRVLSGTEKLDLTSTSESGAYVMRDVALGLQERAKAIDPGLEEQTDEVRDILATTLADEVEAAMEESGHAGHWYSDKLRNAVALVGEIHSELQTDVNAQSMFLAALAITSNGQPVAKNAELAERQYQAYKKTGKFPETGVGKEKAAMANGFKMLNELINKKGVPATRQFLATQYTKRELMDLGYDKVLSGEGTTFATHGSGIFGPKVGAGFYQNLIGNFSPLTTDRWFMRTWGRMVGKLMEDPQSSGNQGRRDRLRKALSTKKGQEKLAELGYNKIELGNETTLADIATILHMEYTRDNFESKSEWNLAAKNLDMGLNDPIAAPSGPVQRNWIREVVAEARSILASRGTEVDTATLQALVWYPEKNLYAQHGVGDAKAQPTDYEQEFARIAEERGIDSARIRDILRRKTGRAPRGIEPREAEGFEALRQPLEPKKRRLEIVQSGVAAVRRDGRATYRGSTPTGTRSLLDGAPVTTVFKPQAFAKNKWDRSGLATPELNQLDTAGEGSIASAQAFTRAITAAKEAHPDGASVYVYPQEEYEGARLYLTEDGMAGFALKDGDIVSVFKHPDLKAPGVVQSMISLAVQEGGRKLDAFDTMLPYFYEMQGFKVVSRLRWDESEAPTGWSKERFADFNNGEPDVVFMVWDSENYNQYTGEGVMAESYDDAVIRQNAYVTETMYPDLGPMRLRIEDNAEEEFVDKHPDHPHSQLFKMAATMEDQANYAPGIAQIVKDKVTNAGDTAINVNLAVIHRNYLNDFMPDNRMSAITDYNHDIREMEGRKGELMAQFQPTAQKMFWHKSKDSKEHARLGEVMHASTINGLDPSKEYQPLKKRENMTDADKKADTLRRSEYKILKDYFDNQLTPESRELYEEVRDQYSSLRDNMEKAIMQRIEDAEASEQAKKQLRLEMRKHFEAGRVQGPYFPLDRWGDRWGAAYNEDGELHSYSKFDTKSEMIAWRNSYEAAGFTVKDGKKIKSDKEQLKALDPALVARLQNLTSGLPESDAIADEIYQLYLRSLPEMSMRKHFLHRTGRIGFSQSILRSYAGQTFHGATQIARMEQQPKLERDLAKLKEQAQAAEQRRDAHSDWAIPLYEEMVERHGLAMNPPKSVVASRLTNLGFAWMLGVTPGAAILNLFQTPMFGFPTVSARKGNGNIKTTAEFLKAIPEYFRTRIGGYKSKLRDDELKAFEWAEMTGIFSKTMSHDLADLIEKDDMAYSARRNIMTAVSFLFHHTEQANRNITFMVAYRLARKRGLNHQKALHDAADLNDRSHYDYSASNRPVIMQNDAAKIVLLFKNYGVHSTYQMGRALKDGFFGQEGLSAESRSEARRKLTGIMMMTAVLGGVSSLPFAWVVETILNAIWGDEDKPYDAGAEFRVYMIEQGYSIEQVEALLTGGWDAMTGTTMSSRISLSYLGLGRESMYELEGKELTAHILEEIAGPVGSILIGAPVQAMQDLSEDRPWRAAERVIPKFARDPMKSIRYATEGALTYSGEPLVTPEQFTNRDLFLQSIGLTPTVLTHRYEQNRAYKNMETKLLKRHQRLVNGYHLALELGDPAAQKENWAEIEKWNKINPQWPIDSKALLQSFRSKERMKQQTYAGVALNPRLDFMIRKQLTYLPVETGEIVPMPGGLK